jgi:hypothetical protein
MRHGASRGGNGARFFALRLRCKHFQLIHRDAGRVAFVAPKGVGEQITCACPLRCTLQPYNSAAGTVAVRKLRP